jgi:hypothetical protein
MKQGIPRVTYSKEFREQVVKQVVEARCQFIFIRMRAANDAGNLEDLRPEVFATFRLELQDRKGATQ